MVLSGTVVLKAGLLGVVLSCIVRGTEGGYSPVCYAVLSVCMVLRVGATVRPYATPVCPVCSCACLPMLLRVSPYAPKRTSLCSYAYCALRVPLGIVSLQSYHDRYGNHITIEMGVVSRYVWEY
eukprot:879845-Rhodomonas_salina.1